MSLPYKFGFLDSEGLQHPFSRSRVWARKPTTGPERLQIAAAEPIALLRKLSVNIPEQFWLLYVLHVTRTDQRVGRYQVAEPISRQSLSMFLTSFQIYLESDGRHHLWIGSESSDDLLVYDNHEVIYAYGKLETYEAVLSENGYEKVDELEDPLPHTHNHNKEYDSEEKRILQYFDWKFFPLEPDDE